MAQAVERLYKLTVDANAASRQLKKIEKNTGRIANGFGALQRAAGAAFGAMAAVRGLTGLTRAADQIELLEGSFEALTGSSARAADMLERVFSTVADTGASLKDVSSTFQRLTIGLRELGGTNEQVEAVANSFIKLGRISGTSMFDTNAALVQFSQGLASGKLQGDELRSIMERLPLITQLIAEEYSRVNGNIKVTRGEVKQLGREGKLSAEIIANALLAASEDIDKQFGGLIFTLEQELNSLASTFTQLLADLSIETGIGEGLRAGVNAANEVLKDFQNNISLFISDMKAVVTLNEDITLSFQAVALILTTAFIPAISRAAIAMRAFALAHPITALALAVAIAVTAMVKNWDRIRIVFLYDLPRWYNQAQIELAYVSESIVRSFQKIGVAIGNSFIDAFNFALTAYNRLLTFINESTPDLIDFGQLDKLERLQLGKPWLDLGDSIKEAAVNVELFGRLGVEALAQIDKKADEVESSFDLFGGDGATTSEQIEEINKSLEEYENKILNALDSTRKATLEFNNLAGEMHFLVGIGRITEDQLSAYIDKITGVTAANEKAAESAKKIAEGWREFEQSITDSLDPFAQLDAQMRKIQLGIDMGEITAQRGERLKAMVLDVKDAADAAGDEILSALERIKNATDGFARDFTNTLVEGLKTGEFAFKQFAISILETMAKIVLNSIFERFFAAIFSGIGGYSGGGSGGGGGGGARTFAEGGDDPAHSVGLLKPPAYGNTQLSGKSPVTITVNNNAPVDVQTTSRSNDNGGVSIDMLITSKVNRAIDEGQMDKSLRANFGLNRRAF